MIRNAAKRRRIGSEEYCGRKEMLLKSAVIRK